MPASGELGNITYFFHGTGCTALIDGSQVEWDWDEEGKISEFDVWKLWQTTRTHPQEFGKWSQVATIKEEAVALRSKGKIEPVGDSGVIYKLKIL